MRQREHAGQVQPGPGRHRPLGSGDRHLCGTDRRPVTDAPASTKKTPIWQRRRGLVIAAAVLVVVLITVLSDLPVSTSRAEDVTAERSVMSEVNADLGPCALG